MRSTVIEAMLISLWMVGIVLYWWALAMLAVFAILTYIESQAMRRTTKPVNLYGVIVRRDV